MKKTFRKMLVAFVAMTVVALVGCEKEGNAGGNSGNGNGTEQPTPDPDPQPQPVSDGWVDLGLPSGLLWAECNVGATAPEEYGDYFAWGETQPKEVYDWSHYHYCTVDVFGNLATLTKYNTSTNLGSVDTLTTLESADDAAAADIGNGARTPTEVEWNELITKTTHERTTLNGVLGCRFTAENGNSIFLPAAGGPIGSDHYGTGCMYWAASLSPYNSSYAWVFESSYTNSAVVGFDERQYGCSIRAVRDAQK